MRYDVVIIGGGPAGYVCAIRAAQLGRRVAVVDREWLGGVCVNVGCIPSKALLRNAEIAHLLRHRGAEYGFAFDNLQLDYGAAVRRSRQVADRLSKGVGFLMKKNGVDVHQGSAVLRSATSLAVTAPDGSVTELEAADVVVATGASAAVPPGITVDGTRVLSYREAILQERLPASVLIVGGSAIGVEFATIWSSYGAAVTVVELLPRLVPAEDEDVSKELTRELKKRKVSVRAGTAVEGLAVGADAVRVTLAGGETVEVEQVLVATGIRPNSAGLGLAEAGVRLTDRGFVEVDGQLRTSVAGVWAIGDVTGKLALAHVGSAQGIVCAEAIAGLDPEPLEYAMLPRAVYSHPQVASFGYTEAQARDRYGEVAVGRFDFRNNGKALGLGETAGFAKVVTDARSGEIVGAHLVGPDVTELLPELTLAHRHELTAEELAHNVHAHPTLSEVLAEAAHGLAGGYVHQ